MVDIIDRLFSKKPLPPALKKRITERLVDYWENLRGSRTFPNESEVNPEEISDIWDSCFLVRVNHTPDRQNYKYSYLGTSLIEAYGDDLTGQDVCTKLISPTSPLMIGKIQEVVDRKRPVLDEAEFTNLKNVVIKYRSCMLPLGPSPDKVDYIIGGMKWKPF